MANIDPFYGMTPIQKIKAIKARPELSLQNPYGLQSGLGGSLVSQTTQTVAPTTVMQQPVNDTYNWGGMTDKDLTGSTIANNGNMAKASANNGGSSFNSYLPSGWFNGKSNGDTYNTKDDGSGAWMKSGMFTDSAAKGTDFGSLAEARKNGFYGSTIGTDGKEIASTYTDEQFGKDKSSQGYLDNQQFNNYAGMGLGALQLGASLYSTFGSGGSMAMNKKNMQLMDGQIANNNDIMATRKARAADISKYFG